MHIARAACALDRAGWPRLIGDIGGTNARFGWLEKPGAPLSETCVMACAELQGIAKGLRHYLAKHVLPTPESAVLAVASPVSGDSVAMTNLAWRFSIEELRVDLGLQRLMVLDDFTALARAIPHHEAAFLYHSFDRFESIVGDGLPSWALSNHDVGRVTSRWARDQLPAFERLAKLQLIAALQMCLRGSPCIYQGDELGLPDAELAFEDLQDHYGISMWPEFKGRVACQTPMPWHSDASDLGFGSGQQWLWLPLSESHRKLAVDRQLNDPKSTLNFYRALLAWRKQIPVLQTGSMRLCTEHKSCLAFFRESENQTLLCVFNLSGKFQRLSVGELGLLKADISRAKPLDSLLSRLALKADRIGLSACGCGVIGFMS